MYAFESHEISCSVKRVLQIGYKSPGDPQSVEHLLEYFLGGFLKEKSLGAVTIADDHF